MKSTMFKLSLLTVLVTVAFAVQGNSHYRIYPDEVQLATANSELGLTLALHDEATFYIPDSEGAFVQHLAVHANAYGIGRQVLGLQLWTNGQLIGTKIISASGKRVVFIVRKSAEDFTLRVVETRFNQPAEGVDIVGVAVKLVNRGGIVNPDRSRRYPGAARCLQPGSHGYGMGSVSDCAIKLVTRLEEYVPNEEFAEALAGIKKVAADALAEARTNGEASGEARPCFEALLDSLDAAAPMLEDLEERTAAFEFAARLMGLRKELRNLLD